jgi:hypothetical protein
MRHGWAMSLAAAVAVGGAAAAQEKEGRAAVVSTGRRVELKEHLRREGTTVFIFINETSAMERQFLQDLEKRLPPKDTLALRVVRLKDLEAPAAKQHEIKSTPAVLVLDRFARPLARSSDPDEIVKAVAKGLRMGRIQWVDEEDPKAPEVYRAPAEALKRGLPGIVKTMSPRPEAMRLFMLMSQIHFTDGFLDRRTHELIASYVSALNKCRF